MKEMVIIRNEQRRNKLKKNKSNKSLYRLVDEKKRLNSALKSYLIVKCILKVNNFFLFVKKKI